MYTISNARPPTVSFLKSCAENREHRPALIADRFSYQAGDGLGRFGFVTLFVSGFGLRSLATSSQVFRKLNRSTALDSFSRRWKRTIHESTRTILLVMFRESSWIVCLLVVAAQKKEESSRTALLGVNNLSG
jgi:hypothetical protein